MSAVTFDSIPQQALGDFLREHWERKPGTAAGANPASDDARLLFRAMCAAARRQRLGDTGVEFVVWLDGAKVAFDAVFAPHPGDASLQGYLERLGNRFPNTNFTVLLADPHLYDLELWERARHWTRLIAAEVGMPNGGVDTCAFLGCYDRTPFGVHRGQMSVLTIPVVGRKRFLLWPYEYGECHREIQDSLDYAAHLDDAIVEQSVPGDLLYWPADFWHVADAPRHPSAAWNIGFWWDRPPLSRVLNAAAELIATDTGLPASDALAFDWNRIEGQQALDDALQHFRDISASGELDDAIAIQWARFNSADGFRKVPEATAPSRPKSKSVRIAGQVVLRCLNNRRLCLAANGHAMLLEDCPDDTRTWLGKLLAGDAVCAQTGDDDQVLAFLTAARALRPAATAEHATGALPQSRQST